MISSSCINTGRRCLAHHVQQRSHGREEMGSEIMCPAESSRTRRGGKKAAAAEQKPNKQPQRGLGVAQLEKIRLHNQMMAAYRSGMHHQDARMMQQVPFAVAPSSELMPGSSPFQPPYHHTATTDRGIVVGAHQCYGNLQPYSSSSPPPLFAHDDVRDSSGHQRLGQGRQQHPPQQQKHHWASTSDGCTEELDLELRL